MSAQQFVVFDAEGTEDLIGIYRRWVDSVEIEETTNRIKAMCPDVDAQQRAINRAINRSIQTRQSLKAALRQEERHIAEGIDP